MSIPNCRSRPPGLNKSLCRVISSGLKKHTTLQPAYIKHYGIASVKLHSRTAFLTPCQSAATIDIMGRPSRPCQMNCSIQVKSNLPDVMTTYAFCAVYADGGICLDILQNQWSPIYDVSAILTSIQVEDLSPPAHALSSLSYAYALAQSDQSISLIP